MITLFLCGDVMTGRGIDQILPHPSDPHLYEAYVRDARTYIELAERVHGPIRYPVDFRYCWGAALEVLDRVRPDARVVNLETSVTRDGEPWPGKGIHYRMHPDNVGCLTAARIDCCVLANNHVADFGLEGLDETLASLHAAGLETAGAGHTRAAAAAPAVIDLPGSRRVLVFGLASTTSGCPEAWGAESHKPGIMLTALTPDAAREAAARMNAFRRPRDVVVASVHWGGNWGYAIPQEEQEFARALVDSGVVDIVHGHSAHHAKGIEIRRNKLILYGCGDFLNDYEGISGRERYRSDLALMYFARVDEVEGRLAGLEIVPLQLSRFRLNKALPDDIRWIESLLSRESGPLGCRVSPSASDSLKVEPHPSGA